MKYGKEGLERNNNNKYPIQFKLDIIKYKLRTGDSFFNVALHFDILEPSLVSSWYKIGQGEEIDELSKPKGRPPMSKKTKKKTGKKLIKEQQLENDIKFLRVENAYLKNSKL